MKLNAKWRLHMHSYVFIHIISWPHFLSTKFRIVESKSHSLRKPRSVRFRINEGETRNRSVPSFFNSRPISLFGMDRNPVQNTCTLIKLLQTCSTQ
ncbi:unnamed protein product [Sphenostylis stenocarpa]|uniref:Uncharacterized protein n=1 Tax=Sphenostylis stenocarpa TaxID=92480 RepID=A0AA86T0S4_9FABA|nr:unnamed protein product [Sphenostylis stenocarpa]